MLCKKSVGDDLNWSREGSGTMIDKDPIVRVINGRLRV